ncbi:hypothetical protein C3L33_11018, partial [Rhododendron williamsianum]
MKPIEEFIAYCPKEKRGCVRWVENTSRTACVKEESTPLKFNSVDPSRAAGNSPVQVPHQRKFYYTSARSMAGSDTPPFKSFIKAKSGPSALEVDSDSSSEDETMLAPSKKYSQPREFPVR